MLLTSLIVSFVVIAIHLTFQEGEVFGFVSKWGYKLPEKLQQPLFSCPICMVPWYGVPVYFIGHYTGIGEFADIRLSFISFVIVVSIGINTVYVGMKPKKNNINHRLTWYYYK